MTASTWPPWCAPTAHIPPAAVVAMPDADDERMVWIRLADDALDLVQRVAYGVALRAGMTEREASTYGDRMATQWRRMMGGA